MLGSQEFHIAEQSASRLRIVAPGWSFMQSWIGLVILLLPLVIIYTTSRTVRRVYAMERSPAEVAAGLARYRLAGLALLAVAVGLLWMLSYTRGEIDFDRGTNVVTMRSKMTVFLPERVQTAPLSSVEEAWLDTKPNARRIRLLRHHGPDLAYPVWSDRPGQQQAVEAINAFTGKGAQ